jgi:hypothetical protein
MSFPRTGIVIGCALFLFRASVTAYGPLGHEIVGGIADERLANTPTAAKISALLDGMRLEKAALIPDEIKRWDKRGVDGPRSFRYSAYRNLDRQLRDFWRANPPSHDADSAAPSHHWFHYTDVPVIPVQRYRDRATGRSRWDVVHMIPFCIDVLQGRIPDQNQRKITKPVALILLAHYVADIHQPLHVGAAYFDTQGDTIDPEKNKTALPDEGGNLFTLQLRDEPPRRRGIRKKKLHGFWDNDTVNGLFVQVPSTLAKRQVDAQIEPLKHQLIREMATREPRNWQMPSSISIESCAEIWADEILPIAQEAHRRLEFRIVRPLVEYNRVIAGGEAFEKPAADQTVYRLWASAVVRDELHKAGWRLADLLEKIL